MLGMVEALDSEFVTASETQYVASEEKREFTVTVVQGQGQGLRARRPAKPTPSPAPGLLDVRDSEDSRMDG